MKDWIFLSKHRQDQYVNMLAASAGADVIDTEDFDYDSCDRPIVLRGILKHKIMKRCWQDRRDFYYVDSGYFGNRPGPGNPHGWKLWHRIVRNNLQHDELVARPDDRARTLPITPESRRTGSKIIVAAPDDKPCAFYGISREQWVQDTVNKLKNLTDRPVIVRERVSSRLHRVHVDPLDRVLRNDVHALVTFNSASAIESILAGVPAFVLCETHAANPVANRSLDIIENPWYPDQDLIHKWINHLAYGQFHVKEMRDGTALRILTHAH